MGFLDNSGDIILDAVLTDLGRKRMAKGTFTITQFALGDDEINYATYNADHPSGSAYYDLQIIQTPILESFTNNTSTMKSRLLTLDNNANILYLPVMIEGSLNNNHARHASNTYLVAVDSKTQVIGDTAFEGKGGVGEDSSGAVRTGVLFGLEPSDGNAIMIHQGIDNQGFDRSRTLDDVLVEDTYVIQIDGRFGEIVTANGTPISLKSRTEDDDGFLFYTLSSDTTVDTSLAVEGLAPTALSKLAGARGTRLEFKIKASSILTDNQSYFDRFGFSIGNADPNYADYGSKDSKAIDSIVRVTGIKTGYSIDIPVRFIKDVTT